AEAMRTQSLVYFDDVCVGDWDGMADALADPAYAAAMNSDWTRHAEGYTASKPGRWITGDATQRRYTLTTQLTLPTGGQAGVLCHVDAGGREGYAWLLSSTGQSLRRFHGTRWLPPVDQSSFGVMPDIPVSLRLEVDG